MPKAKEIAFNEIRDDTICCHNCKFFDPLPKQLKEDNMIGSCKANPPYLPSDPRKSKLGSWPHVLATFWCGLFDKNKEKG